MEQHNTLNFTKDGPNSSGIFATVQGEGRYQGVPSVFARTSGCNLRCTWLNPDGSTTICDTPYSSFKPERSERDIEEVVKEISSHNCTHVVVTGGEPYLQPSVTTFVDQLTRAGHFVTMETNATIYRESAASFISMSPKLSTSSATSDTNKFYELQQKNRYNPEAIAQFIQNHRYQLKFVVNSKSDIEEVCAIREDLVNILSDSPASMYQGRSNLDLLLGNESSKSILRTWIDQNIYLMPQGISVAQFDEKSLWMIEVCKEHSWNYCDRMHIRIWGQKRGV